MQVAHVRLRKRLPRLRRRPFVLHLREFLLQFFVEVPVQKYFLDPLLFLRLQLAPLNLLAVVGGLLVESNASVVKFN